MMDRIKAILGKKIAGVPVLYLVFFAVIGLAIYAWQTNVVTAEDETTEDNDSIVEDPDGDAAGTNQPVFVANPSVQVGPPTDPALSDPVSVDSNELWQKRAATWLGGTGVTTPNNANSILGKYLNGDTLSYEEGRIRDLAIKQYGLPPEPPTESGTSPKPPTVAKPAVRQFSHFPGVHTVKGSTDNAYNELSQLYYGRKTGEALDLLQSKNPRLGHGGPFPIGTKVNIPAYNNPKYYRATSARRTSASIAKANGISQTALMHLNDGMKFPVKVGTRVRVR